MKHAIWIIRLAIVIAFFVLWEGAVRLHIVNPVLIPPFSEALVELFNLLPQPEIQRDLIATFSRIAVAYAIGVPAAVLVGFAVGESKVLGRWLRPAIQFAMNVPQSIFLPIFLLLFGIGFAQKVAFGVTHIFFVLCVTTIAAVHSIPRELVTAARSFGANKRQIYLNIYLPGMLPMLLNGLRLAMIFNVGSVLLAEMYSSRDGIALLLFAWSESGRVLETTAIVLFLGAITVAFNELMRLWEVRLRAGREAPASV